MTIILVAGGYFLDLEVNSTKRMKLSVLFLVKSHCSNRQFMKMFSWNHHSYGCILQVVTHNYLLPWLPHWISKMANHGMCDGKCCPSRLYLLQFFLQISHIWTINKTLQNVFETIVNKKRSTCSWSPRSPYQIVKMATCYGSSFKLEITWGTTGIFVYFCE